MCACALWDSVRWVFEKASLSSNMNNAVRMLSNRALGSTKSMSPSGSWSLKIRVWWTSLQSPQAWVEEEEEGAIYLWLCPTISLLECPPFVILHQLIEVQLQYNNGIQLFDSYKPVKWHQRLQSKKITEHTWDCEKMVYRHGARLLVVRRRSGYFPRRCWHLRWSAGQSASRVWKRRGKRRRETREGQNENATNRQPNTHRGWHEDGMNASFRHIGWLVLSHAVWCACNELCKLHEKNDVWNVSVYRDWLWVGEISCRIGVLE